jgi:hypothetical protein
VPADETCCSMRQRDLDRFSAMNETDITRLCRDPGPSTVKGTRRSFQDRFAESIFGTHPLSGGA